MKPFINLILFVNLTLTAAIVGFAQTTTNQAADYSTSLLQHCAVELTKLRLEVTELQIELQQAKVTKLESDLRQVQTDKKRLEIRQAELRHEIAQLDQQINLPSLEAQARAELASMKSTLSEKTPEKLRIDEQRLAGQEFELNRQLQQEQDRLEGLREKLQRLQKKD